MYTGCIRQRGLTPTMLYLVNKGISLLGSLKVCDIYRLLLLNDDKIT